MHLNYVFLCGELANTPGVVFTDKGTQQVPCPVMVAEHGQGEQVFKTFIPGQAYGKAAEKLSELEQGDLVCLTGKLSWRKGTDDRPGSLGVFVQTVETERVPLPPAAESLN